MIKRNIWKNCLYFMYFGHRILNVAKAWHWMQAPHKITWNNVVYWLQVHVVCSPLSYNSKKNLPRVGIIHRHYHHLILIIYQVHGLHTKPQANMMVAILQLRCLILNFFRIVYLFINPFSTKHCSFVSQWIVLFYM